MYFPNSNPIDCRGRWYISVKILWTIYKLQCHCYRSHSDWIPRFVVCCLLNFLSTSFQIRMICSCRKKKFVTDIQVPNFKLAYNSLILDGFIIAMVSYTINVSMALIFAQRFNYEINFNQELLALGASNVMGSFFSCLPLAPSLSRSQVQVLSGCRTQITSIVSCFILAFVLLWIGPFFEVLPKVSKTLLITIGNSLIIWNFH